jgi:cystathionine beta-lyase/cystathionine gamma-synthase
MLVGGSFYGYVIALMAQLVSKFNINRQMYEDKLVEVKAYMVSRNLPRDLQQRVKQYYKHFMQVGQCLEFNPQHGLYPPLLLYPSLPTTTTTTTP